jgi:hypothetical protein
MISGDGTYARWNPCTSIVVYVNYAGAQPGAREALAETLRQATAATGLQFAVRETTGRSRTNGLYSITVLWLTEREYPQFGDGSVGMGGGAFSSREILEGWVFVNADDPLESNGRSLLLDVLLHEFGHALGLAHVEDDEQVMYPVVFERGSYRHGDLLGLSVLGAEQGCTDDDPLPRSVVPTGTQTFVDTHADHDDADHEHDSSPLQVFESA